MFSSDMDSHFTPFGGFGGSNSLFGGGGGGSG